jgi:hypothetical protein
MYKNLVSTSHKALRPHHKDQSVTLYKVCNTCSLPTTTLANPLTIKQKYFSVQTNPISERALIFMSKHADKDGYGELME